MSRFINFACILLSVAAVAADGDGAPPTVAQQPTAMPTPVTGTTAVLAILGASDAGEATLRYTWQAGDGAPADVAFSANGTNAAKHTVATFTAAGDYQLRCTIADGDGASVTATVGVSVVATLTTITMSPSMVSVAMNSRTSFTAVGIDQFGAPMATPPAFVWSYTSPSIATVDGSGVLTTGATAGVGTLVARVGQLSCMNPVYVRSATAATVTSGPTIDAAPVTTRSATLSVTATSPAGEPGLTFWWGAASTPTNGGCSFRPNATNAAKRTTAAFTRAGSYLLQVAVHDQQNQITYATLPVTVVAMAAGAIVVTPNPAAANLRQPLAFSAAAADQFGQPITAFAWSVSGTGWQQGTCGTISRSKNDWPASRRKRQVFRRAAVLPRQPPGRSRPGRSPICVPGCSARRGRDEGAGPVRSSRGSNPGASGRHHSGQRELQMTDMLLYRNELRRLDGVDVVEEDGLLSGRMLVKALVSHDQVVDDAREVLRVADNLVLADRAGFPSLDVWRETLPAWFVDACGPERSQDENLRRLKWRRSLPRQQQIEAEREERWTLSGWVFWMRPSERNWYWGNRLGSDGEFFMVELRCVDWPCAVASFGGLMRAAGAESCGPE